MPEVRHSVCALDCPDCLLAAGQRRRRPRLPGCAAIPRIPSPADFCAAKWRNIWNANTHPDRLLYPQRRSGRQGRRPLRRASPGTRRSTPSPRACAAIAAEFGPESILPYSYAGTMGLLNGAGMDRRFFHRLGASRLDRTICSTAGRRRHDRRLWASATPPSPSSSATSKLIIAWGANILGTNVHLWPFIVEARRNGAKFVRHRPASRTAPAALPTGIFSSIPAAIPRWRSAMMHVIIGENLHDADYVARYTKGFDDSARARSRMDAAARGATHRHRRRRNRRSWRANMPPRGPPSSA